MLRLEIETLVASQVLQNPALLQRIPFPIDLVGDPDSLHILRAVESLESKGMKVTRYDVAKESGIDRGRVAQIWNAAPTRENFGAHLSDLMEAVKADKLDYLRGFISKGLSDGTKPSEIVKRVEEYMLTVDELENQHSQISIGEALRASVERFQERINNPGLPGVTTGFRSLDLRFGGFEAGKLYYVGARPSQGKTALMLNFAINALSDGIPVGIISVESSERELADRIIANKGNIDALVLRDGSGATKTDLVSLGQVVERFYSSPGAMYHNPRATIADVSIQARRMVKNRQIKVCYIDYVQLIDGGRHNTRQEEVAFISRNLKALASDAHIAVVALAQLRRDAEGKKPTMSDLAEASALEKDADVVMGIHHEEDDSQIHILKARDGQTGHVDVKFIREKLRFAEVDHSAADRTTSLMDMARGAA